MPKKISQLLDELELVTKRGILSSKSDEYERFIDIDYYSVDEIEEAVKNIHCNHIEDLLKKLGLRGRR